MADKILNTRVLLKHGSLQEWENGKYNKTEFLKKGELAIVTVGSDVETNHPADTTGTHPILFKVGTGKHYFSQLPWASALAADVYDWAKLEYSAFLTKLEENFYTETEINTLIAKYSTTTQMNNAIKLETDRALAAEEALGERIDAFNLPENGFASKDDFDALKGKVEGEDGALAKANSAYELAESKITEGEVNTKLADYATKTEAQGYANAKDEAITAAQNAANAAQKDVDALEGNVGSVNGLNTTSKNVVGAINEVLVAVGTGGTAAAVTVEKSTDGLTYTIKQGKVKVGTIDIPKDMVVTAGEVVSNPEGQAEGTYIKLTLANVTDPLYINVGTLVDIYKAQANAAQIQVTIDSATREISATIVAGSITATELADNAVITAKIANANVTKDKLSTEVQTTLDSVADKQDQFATLIPIEGVGIAGVNIWAASEIKLEGGQLSVRTDDFKFKDKDVAVKDDLAPYALKTDLPTVNNGKFTVSGTGALTGSGEMTANQAGNTTATLDLTDEVKGQINGAVQTVTAGIGIKAVKTGTGVNLEIVGKDETDEDGNTVTWIFDCGGAE